MFFFLFSFSPLFFFPAPSFAFAFLLPKLPAQPSTQANQKPLLLYADDRSWERRKEPMCENQHVDDPENPVRNPSNSAVQNPENSSFVHRQPTTSSLTTVDDGWPVSISLMLVDDSLLWRSSARNRRLMQRLNRMTQDEKRWACSTKNFKRLSSRLTRVASISSVFSLSDFIFILSYALQTKQGLTC